LFFSDPEAYRRELREDREKILAATPEQFAEAFESVLSPADAEALTGDLARWFAETQQVALSAAPLTSWGFDLGDIRVPVKIWHGRQDRIVPVQHGQWLAAGIPGAEADISDRDGHLTMIGRIGEIHDWLLQQF
jgi:pimeloyl-ACP methyl ester carboxylesterase